MKLPNLFHILPIFIMAIKRQSNIALFKRLANYCETAQRSRIVHCDEFVDEYSSLRFGNGGSWARFDGNFGKKFKVVSVKRNGDIKYSWEPVDSELIEIQALFDKYHETKNNIEEIARNGNGIQYLFIYGIQNENATRPIGDAVREHFKNASCVACGSTCNIEIDHKNGLYNNPRVLNVHTQTVEDFQPLCKHCNDQKRQTYKEMKRTGVRHSAKQIPALRVFGIDYTHGDATYNPNDVNAMLGTYWYDPVDFMECVRQMSGLAIHEELQHPVNPGFKRAVIEPVIIEEEEEEEDDNSSDDDDDEDDEDG